MRKLIWLMIPGLMLPALAQQEPADSVASGEGELVKHYLVEITSMSKEITFEVLGEDEYKSLQEKTRTKARLFSRALREAKKEWNKNPDTSKEGFPASVAAAPDVKMVAVYAETEKAEARKKELEDQQPEEPEDKRIVWLRDRNTEIRKDMNSIPKNIRGIRRNRYVGNLTRELQRNEEELDRRVKKKEKRERLESTAIQLIEEQISKLVDENKTGE